MTAATLRKALFSESAEATEFDRNVDWVLVLLVAALLCVGLVMLTSASVSLAERNTGNPFFYFKQQLIAVLLGFGLAALTLCFRTEFWMKSGLVLVLLALGLLIAVLIPGMGNTVNGSTRWLSIGGISVMQVSEPARLLMLMYIAGYAVRHRDELSARFIGFMKPMALVTVTCVLLLMEPDFGASVVMLAITLSILFIAGARIRDFMAISAVVLAAFAALALTSPYRLRRITGFLDPWADPYDSGFQLTQSLIAIGSGQWFGAGLGGSVQKLFYLPEAHTDFVFAVIAEEFGLIGSVLLIALFGLLVWRILQVSKNSMLLGRHYQAYLAFGVAIWIAAQVFVNIGVNMGILPTKGLTLPLVSYGRSSMLVTLIAMSLILRIEYENRQIGGKAKRRKRVRRR